MRPPWNTQYQGPFQYPAGRLPSLYQQYYNQFIRKPPAVETTPSPSTQAVTINFQPIVHLPRESCQCGRSSNGKQVDRVVNRMNRGERVIGGEEATIHLFPWIVRLGGGCASETRYQVFNHYCDE